MIDIDPVLQVMQQHNARQSTDTTWIIMLLHSDGSGHFMWYEQARTLGLLVAKDTGIPGSSFGVGLKKAADAVKRLGALFTNDTERSDASTPESSIAVSIPRLFSPEELLAVLTSEEML